jgi:hypothetical protein
MRWLRNAGGPEVAKSARGALWNQEEKRLREDQRGQQQHDSDPMACFRGCRAAVRARARGERWNCMSRVGTGIQTSLSFGVCCEPVPENGRFPAVQHGCVCFDQVLRGDQRLTSTPVEIVRQATTEAALGSAKHLFRYRNKYFRAAQWRVHFFSLRELRERVSAYRRTDGPMPSAVPPGFSARLHPAPSRIARTNPSRWAGADRC